MSAWCSNIPGFRFLRAWCEDQRGVSAVEFAGALPLLLALILFITELGRGYSQANAIEKGIRAGALYAARSSAPLTAADAVKTQNLIKTATLDGSGAYVVSGWGKAGATLSLTTTTFMIDTNEFPVYHITASVPFTPLFPGLMNVVGLSGNSFNITLSHEQVHLGT